MSNSTKPKMMAKFAKERDLECHVRTHVLAGTTFVEIRDFVPSTKTYSRGFTTDIQHLGRLIEELQDVQRLVSPAPSNAPAMAGQGTLFDA